MRQSPPPAALDLLAALVDACTPPRLPTDCQWPGTQAPPKALLESARAFVQEQRRRR